MSIALWPIGGGAADRQQHLSDGCLCHCAFDVEYKAMFSESVTGGGAASFVVHSDLSGQQAGANSGNNSTTLTFDPTADFFPGETVFSTLTTAVQTIGGISLVKGYVWQFTTGVSASSPGAFTKSAADVSADAHSTFSTGVGDVDGDGDLDLIAGNLDQLIVCIWGMVRAYLHRART